jgi:hypothetical protein
MKVSEQNKTFTRAFCKSGRRLSINEFRAEAHKRQMEMRDAARAAEMAEEEVALEKLKVLALKGAARMAATGQAGKAKRISEEAARKAATGQVGKAKRVSEEAARKAATGQAGLLSRAPAPRNCAPRKSRRANRAAQIAPRNHAYTPPTLKHSPCSTSSSYPRLVVLRLLE